MEYKEKVKFAEAAAQQLKDGKSITDVEHYLESEDLKKWDIDKVIFSVKTIQKQQYGELIKNYLLAGTLGDHLDDFDDLSAEIFEEIQYEQIDKIIGERANMARERLEAKQSHETISTDLIDNFFTEDHLDAVIEEYEAKAGMKRKLQNKGLLFIILGTGISIASMMFLEDSIMLFWGLVVLGIYYLIQSRVESLQ